MKLAHYIRTNIGTYILVVALLTTPVVVLAGANNALLTANNPRIGLVGHDPSAKKVGSESQQVNQQDPGKDKTATAKASEVKNAKAEKAKVEAKEDNSYSFSFLHYLFSKFDMDDLINADLLQDAIYSAIESMWN